MRPMICWSWLGDKECPGSTAHCVLGQSDKGALIRQLFPACEQELGGLAYDRKNNLLYLVQLGAGTTEDSPFEPLPIIHVFRVVS